MQPCDRVRFIANPARVGVLGNETDGPAHRQRVLVMFLDGGEDFVSPSTLERVESKRLSPYDCIEQGRFSGADDLRAVINFHRLSGKLARYARKSCCSIHASCSRDWRSGLVAI